MCAAAKGNGAQVIGEDRLKHISRSIREHVPPHAIEHETTTRLHTLFDDVLFTAGCPVLSITHRVAAWNTLCSLIDQSIQSGFEEIRQIVSTGGVWPRALELYLDHAHHARPKSSRQLLVTLTKVLQKWSGQERTEGLQLASNTIAACLIDYEDPPKAKAAIQLLTSFVSKGLLDIKHIPSAFTSQKPGLRIADGTLCGPDLLDILLKWLGKGDFGSTIASSVAIVLDQLDLHDPQLSLKVENGVPSQLWRTPLESAFRQGNINIDDLRAHVFPMLFKRKPTHFRVFVNMYGISDGRDPTAVMSEVSHDAELLYAALQTGKSMGLLVETVEKTVIYSEATVALPMGLVGLLLASAERSARLTGLSLLLTSPTPSKPLSATALGLLKRALGTYFADVDADFRSEVFGSFQRLVDRLRAVTAVSSRSTDQPAGDTSSVESSKTIMQRHQELIKWLLRFLAQELRPTASYQRHISALRCLSILARSGLDVSVPPTKWSKSALGQVKWPFQMAVLNVELHQLLLNLLLDPFDDVRQSAFLLLGLYCSTQDRDESIGAPPMVGALPKKYGVPKIYVGALDCAEAVMYATGRADHADGVAYLYSLYYQSCLADQQMPSAWQYAETTVLTDRLLKKLTVFVEAAQQSLSEAVASYPLHGLLTSLRYVLLQRHEYLQRRSKDELPGILYSRLLQIWDLVKPILCDDAPEGYLPEELEESINDTKETLSYCWRALKEGSLLLGALISQDPGPGTGQDSRLAEYSALCFTQLAELRHRGAFSTVAQTWMLCCSRARSTALQECSQLRLWWVDVLNMIQNNVTINTRRSAGLPSLLCGILAADETGGLVAQAVTDLESIARQAVDPNSAEEGSLAQVHAMNCLKDLLKNSRLGEQSEPFLADALQLSADSLRSDAWAVRNCGLMLFRAVIDRLLGTSEAHFDDAHIQKRISTEAYPRLLDAVFELLKAPADGSTTRFEGVFPALQLLQLTRVPTGRLQETRIAVEALTGSPSWHVRDKAARALAFLTSLSDLSLQLDELVSGGNLHENQVHGALLHAKYVLAQVRSNIIRFPIPDEAIAISFYDCSCLAKTAGQLYHMTRTSVCKAASLDVLRACSEVVGGINATTREQYDHGAIMLTLVKSDQVAHDPVRMLELILQDNVQDPAAATIRQAWSRLLAQYLLAQSDALHESLVQLHDMVVDLSRHDEDAVMHLLQALCPPQPYSTAPISDFVLKVSGYIMHSTASTALKCSALRAVIDHARVSDRSLDLTSVLPPKNYAIEGVNQEFVDQVLQLQVLQAEHSIMALKAHDDESLITDISAWAEACTAAVNGTGIHTRDAAADALGRATGLWTILITDSRLDASLLQLCLAIYDLLNDDDEDIRLLASDIVTRILAGAPTRATAPEPLIASQRLLAFCIKRWPDNVELAKHALTRAFGLTQDRPVTAVAELLAASTQRDTSLFAEEKQNLYIDEAKEVRTWSQVLQKLSIGAIDRNAVTKLTRWVEPGLDGLTSHAQNHPDGALGWSSQADIYTLGLQVVYAAELLFNLAQRGAMIPVQPSELRMKLFATVTALDKAQSSCLWRWEAERVLTESLSNKISSVNKFISKGLEEHV
ncbi:hypothetical protein Slin15195_G058990 [Septoria linicola]|uniref:DUF2428 domain-containing protein n=1 Tax=Septoria linicola TaxID=215465 RepID=A0A9Q9AP91_9PEZI|nr:hypothetical protein Slin14017_G074850 [Septoria linicola]USW52580.1 hypothetical protein Slin15195_G058990 [Septoria linicola]